MCRALLPQELDAGHLSARGGLKNGIRDVPPWGALSRDQFVIVLHGELDVVTVPGLVEEQLAPLAEAGSHLIRDLAAVRSGDSEMITAPAGRSLPPATSALIGRYPRRRDRRIPAPTVPRTCADRREAS